MMDSEKAFEDEMEEALGSPLDEEPKGGWPKLETSRDRLEWMAKEIEAAGDEERAMQEAEDGLNQESERASPAGKEGKWTQTHSRWRRASARRS